MATFENAIRITTAGQNVTTGAASASAALPTTAAGTAPRYVRIAATTESYVKVGQAGLTATNADILVQPADAVILNVQGCSNWAYIQGTSTGKVNITALEDQ